MSFQVLVWKLGVLAEVIFRPGGQYTNEILIGLWSTVIRTFSVCK